MQFIRFIGCAFVCCSLSSSVGYGAESIKAKKPTESKSCEGGYAPQFKIVGDVKNPRTLQRQHLEKYFSSRFSVTYFSGSSGLVTKSYIGVPLLDLLNEAGIVTDPNRRNDILRKYVVAGATDCYEAIIAVADLLPNFGAQHVFVAYETGDGQALDVTEGMARFVITGDKQGGRLVSNVNSITVRSAP